jgi:peptide/nickel transport system permease protein
MLIVLGGTVVVLMSMIALTAGRVASHNPLVLSVADRLEAPGGAHLMGTDEFGRDIYSRVVFSARVSLGVGFSVVVVSTAFGILFGLLAGYSRKLDGPLMRFMDGLMAFPDILLAIALMASLGASIFNVIAALGVVYTPRVARVVRSAVLVIRETVYVQAARSLGAPSGRILFRHILPNALSPVIVQGTFTFAYAVLTEAALSFLGVGVPPYIPSWGNILSAGRIYMQQAPWIVLFPGASIIVTVLGLNLLGDGLRDMLDPRLRNS